MTEETGNELPEDTGKVDLEPLKTADPALYQVVNRRVGTLYGVTKELRGQMAEMGKASKALFDKVQGIEDRGQESERQQILNEISAASEADDHGKVATLTDRLTRLNSNSKDGSDTGLSPKAADTATVKKEGGADTPDLSEFMSSENEARLVTWTNEKDDQGNQVRPWIDQNHPKHKTFLRVAQGVMADASLTHPEMMTEIDSLMGTQKSSPQTTVLTPGTPPRPGKPKPKMTPDQKAVAEAMGVKPEEYMAVVTQSETYPDGSMVKVLELED